MNEMLSVIVPVYKVEPYLARCIKSIMQQTYQNLEIILVDDGSPDQCGKICDSFTEDARIKVIHKENGGLSDARNAGIDAAHGEFITFVDSDDFILPAMYEEMLTIRRETGADVVMCNYCGAGESKADKIWQSITKPGSQKTGRNAQLFDKSEMQRVFFDDKDMRIQFTAAWNKIYPIDFFEKFRFPDGLIHEDEYTSFELLYKASKVAYTREPYYIYLYRNNSIMAQNFNARKLDLLTAFEYRTNFYIEHQEWEFAEKMFIHMIRMTAWLYNEMLNAKDQNETNKAEFVKHYKNAVAIFKKMKCSWNISKKIVFEGNIFAMSFSIYSTIWKMKRNISNI